MSKQTAIGLIEDYMKNSERIVSNANNTIQYEQGRMAAYRTAIVAINTMVIDNE